MKKWLTERFLPMWAKQTVLAENRRLRLENEALRQKLRIKDAYIGGMQEGLRSTKRIQIYNRGGQE